MQKDVVIHARATQRHVDRLQELGQATGLNSSQVLRLLIENARLELRPFPTTGIELPTPTNRAEAVPAP